MNECSHRDIFYTIHNKKYNTLIPEGGDTINKLTEVVLCNIKNRFVIKHKNLKIDKVGVHKYNLYNVDCISCIFYNSYNKLLVIPVFDNTGYNSTISYKFIKLNSMDDIFDNFKSNYLINIKNKSIDTSEFTILNNNCEQLTKINENARKLIFLNTYEDTPLPENEYIINIFDNDKIVNLYDKITETSTDTSLY